jgi:hypothetical protein
VVTWIAENFNVNVSISTASRYMAKLQMSFRLTGSRPRPATFSAFDYVCEAYEFIKARRDDTWFSYDEKRILCLDFVTNSRRLDREKTIAMIGSKQKKLSRPKPKYTNSYLVCVAMEDDGQYEALMFTYDPTFDPDGPRAADVLKWCKEMGISRDRIYYEKSKKSYCRESAAQVATFKALHRKKLRGARIMHDDGGSFKKDGEYVLADGADRHIVFPSVSHGELSVLDNMLFAVAKNQWRTERGNTDLSHDDLYLLWCIDWAAKPAIRSYWVNNFMLGGQEVSLKACEDQLRGKQNSRQPLEERYIAAYESWRVESGQEVLPAQWEALDDYLDGKYWK